MADTTTLTGSPTLQPGSLQPESITESRIRQTKQLIEENADLKKLIADNQTYWKKIERYSSIKLVEKIQPIWNKRNSLKEKEAKKVTLLLLQYRLRGLDPEYFTHGAGAGDCVIL